MLTDKLELIEYLNDLFEVRNSPRSDRVSSLETVRRKVLEQHQDLQVEAIANAPIDVAYSPDVKVVIVDAMWPEMSVHRRVRACCRYPQIQTNYRICRRFELESDHEHRPRPPRHPRPRG